MPRDFFELTPEEQYLILIDAAILRTAERGGFLLIGFCFVEIDY